MSEEFLKAAEDVKKLSYRPSDNSMLELYGLYKQATNGDCTATKAADTMSYLVQKKWDAWNQLKGLSKEEAEAKHIALVDLLKSKE